MPKATKKTNTAPKKDENRPLMRLITLAAQGDIIKTVERESARLKVTYRNGLVEIFHFRTPALAVLVVMTLTDLNTCIEQAKVIRVDKKS